MVWTHDYWSRIRLMVTVEQRSFQWRHVNWSFRLQARGVSLFQCACVCVVLFFSFGKNDVLTNCVRKKPQLKLVSQQKTKMKWSCLLVLLPFFLFFLKLKNLETKKKIHKIHNETPEPKKRPSGPRCWHRHNLRYKAWKNRRNLHGMKWYLHYLKFGQFHLCIYIIYIYII